LIEELTLSCYGVEVRLADAAGLDLCQQLQDSLAPEFAVSAEPGSAVVSYVVTADPLPGPAGHSRYRVSRDGVEVLTAITEEEALRWLLQDIDSVAAQRSQQMLFVHAGVVGWRGLAIVIPGRSNSGKSTLVAELVRRGAVYYSDEFAVLDDSGKVYPYRRNLVLRHGSQPLPTLCLVREDAPAEPLPIGLIVAGSYQPGAAWRPSIVRGAQTVLPLIDSTVLARAESARMLRIAARLAPTLVTLRGSRPEATEVAAHLLDLVDDALVSHALDAENGSSRLTDDLANVAEARLRSPYGRPASPDRQLVAARYVRVTDFLTPAEHRRLLDHVSACQDEFKESMVLNAEGQSQLDQEFRRSRTLWGPRLEEVWDLFEGRLRGMLPAVRQELDIPWFPVGQIERQMNAHGSGGFFGAHVDSGDPAVASRRVSCVYYFHRTPRRYTGGELKLYDTWVTPSGITEAGTYTTLTPLDNSIVFFSSDAFHEVCPVQLETDEFGDSRFTVTIWIREGAWPVEVGNAASPS
jgi:SM-20-related protein